MAISKKIKDLMKEFGISFPPAKTEGQRKGKKWEWESEPDKGISKFKELHQVFQMASVVDRKRLEETYSITWLTLQRKVGIQPDQKVKNKKIVVNPVSVVDFSRDVNKEVLKEKLTMRLAELEAETKSIKSQLKQIESLDEAMLKTIASLIKT